MRVIICGAGIAGLTLGWWLARDGVEVVILERAPEPRALGYMIDFFGSGYEVAERMQLVETLKAVCSQIDEIEWLNEKGDRVGSVNYRQLQSILAGRLISLMRGDLEHALFAALPDSVSVRFNSTIEAITSSSAHVDVTLNTGETERAELLVGADGVHSRVRELVFGSESQFFRYLGYHTAAYLIEDQTVAAALDGQFKLLSTAGKQVGLYPIRGRRVATFFVHQEPNMALPSCPASQLKHVYGSLNWLVPLALNHLTADSDLFYDQVAQIEMPSWIKGRTTLVGDACQAVSLMAGQGASLAMAGAAILAEELRRQDSVDAALQRYESRLRPQIARKQAEGRNTARWIAPSTAWELWLRNTAMHVAQLPACEWILERLFLSGAASVFK